MPALPSDANQVRGQATSTTTAATTVIAAPLTGRIYVTDLTLTNSSATGTTVTLNDSASSAFWVPATSSFTHAFVTPLIVATGTALTFAANPQETTVGCNAQGYVAN
jgi:hypothetical protein